MGLVFCYWAKLGLGMTNSPTSVKGHTMSAQNLSTPHKAQPTVDTKYQLSGWYAMCCIYFNINFVGDSTKEKYSLKGNLKAKNAYGTVSCLRDNILREQELEQTILITSVVRNPHFTRKHFTKNGWPSKVTSCHDFKCRFFF